MIIGANNISNYLYKAAKQDINGVETSLPLSAIKRTADLFPIIGPSIAAEATTYKKHPIVSTIFGSTGGLGARAKDTETSYLGTAVGGGALAGAAIGGMMGLSLLGEIVSSKYTPFKEKLIATALLTAYGAIPGAMVGTIASGAGYGLGHLFGTKR